MQVPRCRWLLIVLLLISTCLLSTYARGGRGGGSRGGGSRGGGSRGGSYSRPAPAPSYRPPPAPPAYRPPPAPPAYKPPPAPPAYKPAPAPAYKPPSSPAKPSETVVVRQPASNPNFGAPDNRQPASNPNFGAPDNRQPAYNPNFKPDSPAGPPPPYSPHGKPVPNAPVGPPPPYPPGGTFGNPPPGVQPPPYPGQPGRPPAYPGQPAPYPVQPGFPGSNPNQPGGNRPYPVQPGYPGSYPNQPGGNRPYPVQPGYPGSYPNQPGGNRPYPVQPGYPGSYPNQPGGNRPYPVQPGYPGNFHQPGVNRPYPVQPLGGNVWQPHQGMPAPVYMNSGGIPTGTNMYTKPHKKKGFIGSLMSSGKPKTPKQPKYYGSYPSPYGVGGMGNMGGLGKHGNSAAMYTILPYMAAKSAPKIKFKPSFGYMPFFMPRYHYYGYYGYHHHHHHYHHDRQDEEVEPEYAKYFDVYNEDYAGKCLRPLKKEHGEVKCKTTFNEIQCDAKCEEGYSFPLGIKEVTNKCWHVTGVWRPKKNFPDCKPVCEKECLNGGQCVRPGVCRCIGEFRGSRCQLSLLKCDIRVLAKGENIGWVCNHFKNETVCKISCKEPANFETPPADQYKCTPEGVWTPNTMPHCVIKEEKEDLKSILLEKSEK